MSKTVKGAPSSVGWLPLCVLGLVLAGCPGSLANPERFVGGSIDRDAEVDGDEPPGSCDPVADIFSRDSASGGCNGALCHKDGAFLDLVTGTPAEVFDRVSAQNAGTSSGPCSELTVVTVGDADASTLVQRVTGSACGTQMPSADSPLSAAEVDCIKQWIVDNSN